MSDQGPRVSAEYLKETGEILRPAKLRSYALMGVRRGQRVLDVGCGPGTDTLPLCALVGEEGFTSGVDGDQGMVIEAEARAAKEGLSARAKHIRADATRLPFSADTFDSCRSERLFQHLARPDAALSEMVRVTRPGGRVVVLDTDWGSLSVATGEVEVERRLARVRAEHLLSNGYAGRLLYGMFRRLGLKDVRAELHPVCLTDYRLARSAAIFEEAENAAYAAGSVTDDELRRWHADLAGDDMEGTFFATVTLVMVVGTKVTR